MLRNNVFCRVTRLQIAKKINYSSLIKYDTRRRLSNAFPCRYRRRLRLWVNANIV